MDRLVLDRSHVAGAPSWTSENAPCGPRYASEFAIEGRLITQAVWVDVRRYGWDRRVDSAPWPGDDRFYLSLSLSQGQQSNQIAFDRPRGPRRFMVPGKLMFVPSGHPLHVRAEIGHTRLVCCLFDNTRASQILGSDWSEHDLQAGLDLRNPVVRSSVFRLAQEAMAPGYASEMLADALSTMILVELARHFRNIRADAKRGKLSSWQMRLIRERIEDFDDNAGLNLSSLATECRISTGHLTRSFRASFGTSIGDYITEARMQRAKGFLATGDKRVKEIALACGFSSQASFAAAFRRAVGVTPLQFRQASRR